MSPHKMGGAPNDADSGCSYSTSPVVDHWIRSCGEFPITVPNEAKDIGKSIYLGKECQGQ